VALERPIARELSASFSNWLEEPHPSGGRGGSRKIEPPGQLTHGARERRPPPPSISIISVYLSHRQNIYGPSCVFLSIAHTAYSATKRSQAGLCSAVSIGRQADAHSSPLPSRSAARLQRITRTNLLRFKPATRFYPLQRERLPPPLPGMPHAYSAINTSLSFLVFFGPNFCCAFPWRTLPQAATATQSNATPTRRRSTCVWW